MARARQQHEEAVRAFEQKRTQRELAVPTGDVQVKAKLREFGEPVCIFGEGPYERRDRLRTIMAGRTAPTLDAKRQESTGDEDLFYTEGLEELLEARVKIAEWSLAESGARLFLVEKACFANFLLVLQRFLDSDSGILVPPEASVAYFLPPPLDFGLPSSFEGIHWISFGLGLACGILAGPLLDFLLLLRLLIVRSTHQASRLEIRELRALLESLELRVAALEVTATAYPTL
ncbi:Prpf4 [Symbiodinium sp. CCMP2592]|nr:Prpf4 [Symbiodinium sp. CCMP2592]